ncbi:MAG: hypothetical protein XD93_0289 [candidate division WS6 bacterium 34_10]|uniref:Uncharacterized protein n=1 Tax=candidate division WS6 bacterium 34_10 TaxID=1641389 RepID=A0A101HIK2_9BACT|nr:MAG: hypothetical protein XD93_0289 [candidate division WS6 bacterium 34_10]
MAKYSLTDFLSLSKEPTPVKNLQEDLLFEAMERYLEKENPPNETLKILREIIGLEEIGQILTTLREKNPSFYMYYFKEELNLKATILLNYIQERGDHTEIQTLQEIIKTEDSNNNPIQQMEVIDEIYERYKIINTIPSV